MRGCRYGRKVSSMFELSKVQTAVDIHVSILYHLVNQMHEANHVIYLANRLKAERTSRRGEELQRILRNRIVECTALVVDLVRLGRICGFQNTSVHSFVELLWHRLARTVQWANGPNVRDGVSPDGFISRSHVLKNHLLVLEQFVEQPTDLGILDYDTESTEVNDIATGLKVEVLKKEKVNSLQNLFSILESEVELDECSFLEEGILHSSVIASMVGEEIEILSELID